MNMKVGLLFKINPIGEYEYVQPVYYGSSGISSVAMHVYQSKYNGTSVQEFISPNNNDIMSLFKNEKAGRLKFKAGDYASFNRSYYVLPINEEIRKTVYKMSPNVSNDIFLYRLSLFCDAIGKNISSIELKDKSIFVNTKDAIDLSNGVNYSSDAAKEIYNVTFQKPKVKKAELSATQGGSYTSATTKNNSSTVKKPSVSVTKEKETKISSLINPNDLKKELKKKIINQDKTIDMVVNNIYLNQQLFDLGEEDEIRNKASILLDGPTGTGKTFILKETAKNMNLPFVVVPTNSFSTTGYKGASLTDILISLLEKSGGNLELAQRGIIAFDEFDKIAYRSNDRDALGMKLGLQQELLTFIEGSVYDIEYDGKRYEFDTSKLTVVGMGAFTNLRERKISEIERKYNKKNTLGFSTIKCDEDYDKVYTITQDDYISEGLGRELIGRFTCLTFTKELDVVGLEKILRESSVSPLTNLKKVGAINNCKIEVDDDMIHEIAVRAYESNTGARGLNQVCQSLRNVISNHLISGDVDTIVLGREHLEQIDEIYKREYHGRSKY